MTFIELDYTGRAEGMVFDTTRRSDAPPSAKGQFKPVIVKIGSGQLLPGLDAFLKGKSAGKYQVHLPPEQAFGKKDAKLLKLVPVSAFQKEQRQQLGPGMPVTFGEQHGVVKSISGGRVVVDFNHYLAGVAVDYDLEIHAEVTDAKRKVEATLEAMLGVALPVTVEGTTVTVSIPKGFPAEGMIKAIAEHAGVTVQTKEIDTGAPSQGHSHDHHGHDHHDHDHHGHDHGHHHAH